MNLEHSISPQDVKYQFTWQASYDLPAGRGRALNLNGVADAVLGGWTADGVFYMSSGIPIASPVVNAPISYFNQRPNLNCDPGKGAPHTADAVVHAELLLAARRQSKSIYRRECAGVS